MSFTEKAQALLAQQNAVQGYERNERNEEKAEPWDRLLESVGACALAEVLTDFRAKGCALNVGDDRVFFGPYDDFTDCGWSDAEDWWRDYRARLKPHERELRRRLGGLLPDDASH